MRFCNKQSISEDLYKELLLVTIVMFSFSSNDVLPVGCFCGVTVLHFSHFWICSYCLITYSEDMRGSCSRPSSSLCLL